ncbi:MAG TPA: hypothetical protein ENJ82_03155, partial [Bacteroidetes bacterium]|nr:hypothetical protein [Bacteroidota bacterium]
MMDQKYNIKDASLRESLANVLVDTPALQGEMLLARSVLERLPQTAFPELTFWKVHFMGLRPARERIFATLPGQMAFLFPERVADFKSFFRAFGLETKGKSHVLPLLRLYLQVNGLGPHETCLLATIRDIPWIEPLRGIRAEHYQRILNRFAPQLHAPRMRLENGKTQVSAWILRKRLLEKWAFSVNSEGNLSIQVQTCAKNLPVKFRRADLIDPQNAEDRSYFDELKRLRAPLAGAKHLTADMILLLSCINKLNDLARLDKNEMRSQQFS